jgi:hypothetical protein
MNNNGHENRRFEGRKAKNEAWNVKGEEEKKVGK